MSAVQDHLNSASSPSTRGWWTGDELAFIDLIDCRRDRTAINGYIAGFSKRQNFGHIKREAIEQRLKACAKA